MTHASQLCEPRSLLFDINVQTAQTAQTAFSVEVRLFFKSPLFLRKDFFFSYHHKYHDGHQRTLNAAVNGNYGYDGFRGYDCVYNMTLYDLYMIFGFMTLLILFSFSCPQAHVE